MDRMLGDSWLSGHREVSLWAWTTRRREQWGEEGARNQCSPSRPNAHSRVISGSSMSKVPTCPPPSMMGNIFSQRQMIWMAGKTPRVQSNREPGPCAYLEDTGQQNVKSDWCRLSSRSGYLINQLCGLSQVTPPL